MQKMIPDSRPQKTKAEVLSMIKAAHPNFEFPDFFVCGIRGYYEDSMGKVGVNDRAIYDDALFLIGKDEFHAFNGNTDPGAYRHGIATLMPGVWAVYKFDLHNGKYLALCQRAGKVSVTRDGKGVDTGMFGINNHEGGINTTGSLGCQTVPKPQWKEYIGTAVALAKKYHGDDWKEKVYTYVLLEEKD